MARAGYVKKNSSQKIKFSFLNILTGSDLSRRRLPFMSAKSVNPGPVVWLTGCGHGDEVGGIVVIQEIFKRIRKKPLKKGSLFAFPLMNPIGFETSSRNITPSKEDLNRSFPGNKNGSLAERIADRIFSTIIDTNPSLVLDLHNDWLKSIPYTIIDIRPKQVNQELHAQIEKYGKISGFLLLSETEEVAHSLSHSLIAKNIPALTMELGESYVVNEKNIEYGVHSIMGILSEMEMVEKISEPFQHPFPEPFRGKILKYSDMPLSSTSGIIRFLVKPGEHVKKGQAIARISNAFGKLQETIIAPEECVVIGHSESAVAFPGMQIIASGMYYNNRESADKPAPDEPQGIAM